MYGGKTVECPKCNEMINIGLSDYRYAKISHSRDCNVWLKVDRHEGSVIGVECK